MSVCDLSLLLQMCVTAVDFFCSYVFVDKSGTFAVCFVCTAVLSSVLLAVSFVDRCLRVSTSQPMISMSTCLMYMRYAMPIVSDGWISYFALRWRMLGCITCFLCVYGCINVMTSCLAELLWSNLHKCFKMVRCLFQFYARTFAVFYTFSWVAGAVL